ncbi:VWA domain containing CoxE-like protein [Planctomycetes bacterium Pla163]|uniref:VWA domain containing CoxE-like protein n=1 Tax=Rohdeia mirabilis TaxID=2528008 RepID=A0A518D150_9BACT|nr:VWA domain containing CoxE-like protein [Planctomycetes bacterium Pla163]
MAAALLAAFGAFLAWPRPTAADEPRDVCLIDVSASVRRTRPQWSAWVGAEVEAFARAAERRGAGTWVVAFADGGSEVRSRRTGRELLDDLLGGAPLDAVPPGRSALATDTAATLRAIEPWITGGRGGRLVWLSDGEVGDDPQGAAETLARLARRGIRVELVEPPPPTRADVRLARLELPSTIEEGAPLAVRLEVARTGPLATDDESTAARVRVDLMDPSTGVSVATWSVPFTPDATGAADVQRHLAEFAPPPPGLWVVRARIELAGDAAPENDVLERTLRVGGVLVGGVIARPAGLDRARALATSLEANVPGTRFETLLTSELAGLVGQLDLVVAVDVPPADLPLDTLDPWVRAGGGLLTIGGPTQHVARDRGPGIDLLPLVCVPPGDEPRDVVLLLDGSGSMEGEPFAAVQSASRDLFLSTPPGDGLEVTVFTDGLIAGSLEVRAGDAFDDRVLAAAESWLSNLRAPGGETSIVRSLEQWARERIAKIDAAQPRRAVVVLLTDGREDIDTPNVGRRVEAIRAELARVRCTLYSVAIGNEVDREFLAALVPAPERRLEPAASDLRRAVADAAALERLLQGPLRARRTDAGAELGLPPVMGEWERASRAVARDAAQVLLVDGDDHPLCAQWSVGLGRVVSLAGEVDWIPDLRFRSQTYGGILRHLARRAPQDGPRLVRDDRGLLLTGADVDQPTLVGQLRTVGRDKALAVRLESGPDGYRAAIADLRVLEASADGGWLEVEGLGRWPVPARPPRELRGPGQRLVLAGLPVAGAEAAGAGQERSGHPAAPYVLGLAGLLALLASLPLPGVGRWTVKRSGRSAR